MRIPNWKTSHSALRRIRKLVFRAEKTVYCVFSNTIGVALSCTMSFSDGPVLHAVWGPNNLGYAKVYAQ